MIEYFEPQLRQASSIMQLVQFVKLLPHATWNPQQGFQPPGAFEVLLTVHPEYQELQGLDYMGMHGGIPIFQKGQ